MVKICDGHYGRCDKIVSKLPPQITYHISVSKGLSDNHSKIFSKDNLGALENYAAQKGIAIQFKELKNDMFHNTEMTVFRQAYNDEFGVIKTVKEPLNVKTDTKENFVNSLREIYTIVANTAEKLKSNS